MKKSMHKNGNITLVIIVVGVLLLSSFFLPILSTHSRGEEVKEFSNGKESKTVYIKKTGLTREVANITLPYDADIEEAKMEVSTFYNNGSYLQEPKLSIKPRYNEITIWEFKGSGYGEFGRQTLFVDNEDLKTFSYPQGGGEFNTTIRLPKNATISQAVLNITGEPIGYGEVSQPENASGGTHYPHSVVDTPAILKEGNNLYMVWVDNGDLNYANTDYDVFFKYSTDNGESWSETRLLSNLSSSSCYYPEIASYGNYVYVIWQEVSGMYYNLYFRISDDYGKTWGTTYYLEDVLRYYYTDSSTIAVEGDHVYIAWEGDDGIYIIISSDNGESWGEVQKLTPDDSKMTFSEPTLAAYGDYVYVGYIGYREGENGTREYHLIANFSSDRGESWDGNNVMSVVNERIAMPQIRAFQGYVYFAVVTDYSFDSGNITFVRSDDNGQSWNDPVDVTANPLEVCLEPDLSVYKGMGSQDLYLVWERRLTEGNTSYNISFSKSVDNGDTWELPTQLTTSDDNTYPAITSDEFSNIFVVWEKTYSDEHETLWDIYMRKSDNGGSTWDEEVMITTETFDGNSYSPSYYLKGENHYFVWVERGNFTGNGNDYDIFFRYKDGENDIWYEQVVVSEGEQDGWSSEMPEVGADSGGNVYVVWIDDGGWDGDETNDYDICFKKATNHGSGVWSSVTLLSQQTYTNSSSSPSLAVYESGANTYLGVAWSEKTEYGGSGEEEDIFFRLSNDGGENWGEIELVSVNSSETSYYPDVTIDDSYVYVVWYEYNSTERVYKIFFAKRHLSGGAWTVKELEEAKDGRYPQIVSSGDGYLYLGWVDSSGSLMFSKSDDQGESWSKAVEIESGVSSSNYHLGAFKESVSFIYRESFPWDIMVNASSDRGESWTGAIQVNVDKNSTYPFYPVSAPSEDGNEIYCVWQEPGNVSGTSYDNDILFAELSLKEDYPENPKLDIGDDGSIEWSHPGEYKDSEAVDIENALSSYLSNAEISGVDSYNNAYVDVPLSVSSDSKGRLILDSLIVHYNVSVVIPDFSGELQSYLNNHEEEKDENGNIRVPINLYSKSLGALQLSELSVTYSFEPYLDLHPVDSPATGEVNISWEAKHFGGENLVLTYYNFSEGEWHQLAVVDPELGFYIWDASNENGEFKIKAERESGSPSKQTSKFKIDNLPPKSTETVSPSSHVKGWRREAEVYISASDLDGSGGEGSGVYRVYYTLNGSEPDENSSVYHQGSSISFDTSGNYTLKYRAVDYVGLWEAVHTLEIKIDKDIPVVKNIKAEPAAYLSGALPVEVVLFDNLSGFDFSSSEKEPLIEYCIGTETNKGEWKKITSLEYSTTEGYTVKVSGYTEEENWSSFGGKYLFVRVTVNDSVGNKLKEFESDGFLIVEDTEKPNILEIYINWSEPLHTPGSVVSITVISDEEGLNGEIKIQGTGGYLDTLPLNAGENANEYSAQWDTTGLNPGIYSLEIKLRDAAGNEEKEMRSLILVEEPRADVKITSVKVNDQTELTEVGIGSKVYVNATLYNYGNLNATDIVVIFKDDGVEFARKTVELLEPSRSVEVSALWTINGSSGEKHKISVEIEETGFVFNYTEEIEFKNYPDVVAKSVVVLDSEGSEVTKLKKGVEYTLTAELGNEGDADAQDVVVKFRYKLSSSQIGIIGEETVTITKDETKEVSIKWTPAIEGDVEIYVTVDPEGVLGELSKENNEVSLEVTIEKGSTVPTEPAEEGEGGSILLPVMIVMVVIASGIGGAFFFLKQRKEGKEYEEESFEEERVSTPPKTEEVAKVPQKIKIKCPGCEAVLSVSATAKRPLKITCPKCATPIVLKEKGEAEEEKKEAVRVKCSGCNTVMVIRETKRPIVVKCPKCQTKTTLEN